jgi:hypothetical protein
MSARHGVRRGGMISCAKRGVLKKDRGGKKKRRAVHAGHPPTEIERTGNVQRSVENADDKTERQRDAPQCSMALKGEQQQNAGNQAGEPPRESECRDRKKRQQRDGRGEQYPRRAWAGGCRGQLPQGEAQERCELSVRRIGECADDI